MLRSLFFSLVIISVPVSNNAFAGGCPTDGVQLQVLGSGGPQNRQERAGTAYLVWIDGKSRLLVNAGDGSSLRFHESGARFDQLDVIALSRLHADHSAGLPGLIGTAIRGKRSRPLPVFGPEGSKTQPSTVAFIRTLFDERRGAWRELGKVLSPLSNNGFKLQPHDIRVRIKGGQPELEKAKKTNPVFASDSFQLSAAAISFDNKPAVAWRVQAGETAVIFIGDSNGAQLEDISRGAHTMVAHLSTSQTPVQKDLARYMTPRDIGKLASKSGIKQLVLAHRMLPTPGQEKQALAEIKKVFDGKVSLADDLSCYAVE
jgi:ribonuclease BN (tRNA processing enzyme)